MDFLIGSGIATFLIYAAVKWNKTDKDKIDHTFKNVGYMANNRYPRLFKTHRTSASTTYSYHVPYGLIDEDKLNVLEKTLNKPTRISFANGKLHIKFFNEKLPNKINYNWQEKGVPIGYTQDGLITHDFDKIPHMTISGMTRYGKTVLLKLLFSCIINDHANIHIIDLKGGLEFYRYRNQVTSISSNVKETRIALAEVLNSIEGDMSYFKEKGYTDIRNTNLEGRTFIIVDEGAELVPKKHLNKEDKKPYQYCQHALSEIARIGGGLGYRLIFATQYPTVETLPREIKQNADAKITFRLPTEVASRVAIDESGAEKLTVPGRAIYKTHDKKIMQVPYVTDEDVWEHVRRYERDDSARKKTKKGREDIITFE